MSPANQTVANLVSVGQSALHLLCDPGYLDHPLRWWSDEAAAPGPDAPPGLFTALQEQAGLKLKSINAPVDVLVIGKVGKPSAN
jgi:hypothetical protein